MSGGKETLNRRAQRALTRQEIGQRRWFLKKAALVGGVVVTTGGLAAAWWDAASRRQIEKDREAVNVKFVATLKELMGIQPGMTLEQIAAETVVQYQENPLWMCNQMVGKYMDLHGQEKRVWTDERGESRIEGLDLNAARAIEYVDSGQPIGAEVFSAGNNHLVIYGRESTIAAILEQEEMVRQFLGEYFNGSIAPTNVLHLNFLPRQLLPQLIDVGTPPGFYRGEQGQELAGRLLSNQGTVGIIYSSGDTMMPVRVDSVMSLQNIHRNAAMAGLEVDQNLRGCLANELFNAMQEQLIKRIYKANEAGSTFAGWMATFDDDMAGIFLGGETYGGMVGLVTREMGLMLR